MVGQGETLSLICLTELIPNNLKISLKNLAKPLLSVITWRLIGRYIYLIRKAITEITAHILITTRQAKLENGQVVLGDKTNLEKENELKKQGLAINPRPN